MASAKGEAKGTFRMVPHRPPLTPPPRYTPRRLLKRSARLVDFLSEILFCRGKGFVFTYSCSY